MKDSPVYNVLVGKSIKYNTETKRKPYERYDDIGVEINQEEANVCLSCDLPECRPGRNCPLYKYRRGKKQ